MTRVPRLRALFREVFGREASPGVNADEAAAVGAAVQGAELLLGTRSELLLLDVVPLSLGVQTQGGALTRMIERNTKVPMIATKTFSTAEDNQRGVTLQVYQGERPLARDNRLLGMFNLDGIESAPRGVAEVEVTFEVDANGILAVTARDVRSGRKKTVRMTDGSAVRRPPRALLDARDRAERVCREAATCAARAVAADRAPLEALVDRVRGTAGGDDVAAIDRDTAALVQALEALRRCAAGTEPPHRPAEEWPRPDGTEINLEL
jgi:molecular chaperone DnaK